MDLFTNFNTREYVRDGGDDEGYAGDNVGNNVHSSTWKPGCRVLWGRNGIEERFALRRGGGRDFWQDPQSDGVPPTMINEEDLESMARRIVALGFSRKDAETLTLYIGDTPSSDAHSGKLIARFPDGRSVLLPRTVMIDDSEGED